MSVALKLVEHGLMPDFLLRWGIRGLLKRRLKREYAKNGPSPRLSLELLLETLRNGDIARVPKSKTVWMCLNSVVAGER